MFGSYDRDEVGPLSDPDVAIEFELDVEPSGRRSLLGESTAAITSTTGGKAVDLVDLDAVGPGIGSEALAHGILVPGDRDRVVQL